MTSSAIKNVLITGGARRIGRAIALGLAEDGWGVAIHYGHSADDANQTVQDIVSQGGRAAAFQADLADVSALSPLVDTARTEMGPLTALINNASVFANDDLESLTEDSWGTHLDTNLRAPSFLAQAFAKQVPDGETGNIINMIDQRVWRLTPRFPVLHDLQSGSMDIDADPGPGTGASDPRERHWTGSDTLQRPAVQRGLRGTSRRDSAPTSDFAGRNLRRCSIYPCQSVRDGPNDRSRQWSASCLGDPRRCRARMIW